MNDDDNAYLAWRQAHTDNGTLPGGAMKLDLKKYCTDEELTGLSTLLKPGIPPDAAKLAINLIRQMLDPDITGDEEAAVLLNFVRSLNEPKLI
jgi:hypothetical protein